MCNIFFISCNRQVFSEDLNFRRISRVTETRKLLKEYALCGCITYATDVDRLKKDISHGIYIEISNYGDRDVYKKIDSMSKAAALGIKPSQIADYGYQKPLLLGCMNFYKSKKLDSLVRSFDRIYIRNSK